MTFLLNNKSLGKNIWNVFNFFVSPKRLRKKEKLKGKRKFLGPKGRSALVEWYLLRKLAIVRFQSILFLSMKNLFSLFLKPWVSHSYRFKAIGHLLSLVLL
jgi:hypothetical protein